MAFLWRAFGICGWLLASVRPAVSEDNPSWRRPFPPHHIAGPVYYVGTEDLACFLLTSRAGHILINTGLAESASLIRQNVQKLGYQMKDIRILLTLQAHYDHVAAMHQIQNETGAKFFGTAPDAPVLRDGARSDPSFGKTGWFEPVRVDRVLHDGDVISLGDLKLTVIMTPGHTKGSVSYATDLVERGKTLHVLFANMNTVIMPLVNNKWYPNIVSDFETSFARQKTLTPDIWLAAHASQYDMNAKYKRHDFVDPAGYQKAVATYEQQFRDRLQREQAGRISE